MGGMLTNFYGKLFGGMTTKQKRILIIGTTVSVFIGLGIYGYYKLKQKGFRIAINPKDDNETTLV